MKRITPKNRKNLVAAITMEPLEGRQLMSVSPYVINGTPGNDVITVNYGMNLVLQQTTTATTSTTKATTTTPTKTTVATTALATTAKATTATATSTSTATPAALIFHPPTILDQLTVTIDGVKTVPTLAAGQSVVVNGLDGNDLITVTGNVTTQLNGGNGNDTMIGGTGADQFNGGAGTDTVDYSARTAAVSVTLDGLANDGAPGEGDNVGADVEIVNGGSGNDYIAANPTDPVARIFNGNAGNDTIRGGAGNDQINGGAGNDYLVGNAGNDTIHGGAGDDLIEGSDGGDVLYADSGNDFLFGENGNDHLYGGLGENDLYGGDGDDILVSIGGSHSDNLYGGAGNNSFWCDAESTEIVHDATPAELATNVHRVAAYDALHVNGVNVGAPSRNIGIGNLPDPGDAIGKTTYAEKNFASTPLFADGVPISADINQGAAGDCYFLATLSSVAKVSPSVIEQHIVDLGDGTYCVDFKSGNTDHFIRVDADLPVSSNGNIVYDHFGSTSSLWAPIMEKAWAFFRTGAGSYTSTNNGFPAEAFNALGITNNGSYMPHNTGFLDLQSESATDFGNHLCSLLSSGDSVMLCTPSNSMYLEDSHCYMVDHVNKVGGKVVSITLRNPWGTDGKGGDGVNDGYVTMTTLDALESCDLISYGHV